jgi:hypothetical protein
VGITEWRARILYAGFFGGKWEDGEEGDRVLCLRVAGRIPLPVNLLTQPTIGSILV